MKNIHLRLIIIILCLTFFTSVKGFAYEKKSPIEDELLQNDKFKHNQKLSSPKVNTPITDELLNPELYETSPFRLSVYTNKYAGKPIEDDLLTDSNFIANSQKYVSPNKIVTDEYFIEKNIDLTKVRKIKPKTKYDFAKKQIPIQIKIASQLKSTRHILEGSVIPFIAQHDFVINGKKYDSGTTILGRVETVSASDKMGTPESLQISNFYIPDEKEIDLYGSISKTGANRSIWVYPLYQAGNICFYAAGFAVVPIHGGRVKLSTSETFTVFFETQ